jgi:hypothetical protein
MCTKIDVYDRLISANRSVARTIATFKNKFPFSDHGRRLTFDRKNRQESFRNLR